MSDYYLSGWAIIGAPPEDRSWPLGAEGRQSARKPLIGEAARLEAFVTVDAGTSRHTCIGARTWLMKKVHVGHDATIGADCELAPGVVVCGWAEIGDGVKVGVNASILPYVKVGDGARIGAGAVVTKDVPAGETWAGNPARNLHPKPGRVVEGNTAERKLDVAGQLESLAAWSGSFERDARARR